MQNKTSDSNINAREVKISGFGTNLAGGTTIQSESTYTQGSGLIQNSCAATNFLTITTGKLGVDKIRFGYDVGCGYTIVTVSQITGTVNFTNCTVQQTFNTQLYASPFIIQGVASFINVLIFDLKLQTTDCSIITGSPVELYFNECKIENISSASNTKITPSVISSPVSRKKVYYFNATDFVNISACGNGTQGALMYFNSSVSGNDYTFDNCKFQTFTLISNKTYGVISLENIGKVNFTKCDFSGCLSGGYVGAIYSKLDGNYIGRCTFSNVQKYTYGMVYSLKGANAQALSVVQCSFSDSVYLTYAGGIYFSNGDALSIISTNFTNLMANNKSKSGTQGGGMYVTMATDAAQMALQDVVYRNITAHSGCGLYLLKGSLVATNTYFGVLDAGDRPGGVEGQSANADLSFTLCVFENITSVGLSAAVHVTARVVWNSCLFQHIHSNGNGGLCCQLGNVVADNTTFENCSTTNGIGGGLHWHAGSTTFTRCVFNNNWATKEGGALTVGGVFFFANSQFLNNTSINNKGHDVYFNVSASLSETNFYGCCSTSNQPRLGTFKTMTGGPWVPDISGVFLKTCTLGPRHVAMAGAHKGNDATGCGENSNETNAAPGGTPITITDPCHTIAYTASEYFTNNPLYIVVWEGDFPESVVVRVVDKHIMVNGTTNPTQKSSVTTLGNVATIFNITTGTLTLNDLHFIHPRGGLNAGSTTTPPVQKTIISLVSNGTMTVRRCFFTQHTSGDLTASSGSRAAPFAEINSAKAVVIFEACDFSNAVFQGTAAIDIAAATSVDFLQGCKFTNISAVLVPTNVSASPAQFGGVISSNAGLLTVTLATFAQCTSVRNGGAIYLTSTSKFRLTDATFDECRAASGGAIYTEASATDATARYLARCDFLHNIATAGDQDKAGNDIRDVSGMSALWHGANIIDCCSISNSRKFSVGSTAGTMTSYEHWLPRCFENFCLEDYTAATCPIECENITTPGQCLPVDCTRMHYESTCSASCAMVGDDCVVDPCFALTEHGEMQCIANFECRWALPSTFVYSSGDPIPVGHQNLTEGQYVCMAAGPCTRVHPSQPTCANTPGCITYRGTFCVRDKCAAAGSIPIAAECPQDCDNHVPATPFPTTKTCVATKCTRQGTDTGCNTAAGCTLESSGPYTGRCTVDVCAGLSQGLCTPRCRWHSGSGPCEPHECTNTHNETNCTAAGCFKNSDGLCIVDPCYVAGAGPCPNPDCPLENSQCTHTKCTRLYGELQCATGCVLANDTTNRGEGCRENTCEGLGQGACESSDCTWVGGAIGCQWNKCVRLNGETNCRSGCHKDSQNRCIIDPCEGLLENPCKSTDCTWNTNPAQCQYHSCVRLHNYETVCPSTCRMNANSKCRPDPCISITTGKTDCEARSCTWNPSETTCEFNSCTPFEPSDACTLRPACTADKDSLGNPTSKCVPNPCYGKTGQTSCELNDCTWNGASSQCILHECVRLNEENACYSGCQMDRNTRCVIDPCKDLLEDPCKNTDCSWNGAKCEYQNCVRLHGETECYSGCVKEQNKNRCTTDPCQSETVLNANDCTAKDCTWNSTASNCTYNSCVRLNGDISCYSWCKPYTIATSANQICVQDPCVGKNESECKKTDCTWSGATCSYNSCVRLRDGDSCPTNCKMDPAGFCVPDPCAVQTGPSECQGNKECSWESSTCVSNQCTRLHGDTEECYTDCYLDSVYHYCLLDPCTTYETIGDCTNAACLWNSANSKCSVDGCQPSYQTNQAGVCQEDICAAITGASEQDRVECETKNCTWDNNACKYNPCVWLNGDVICRANECVEHNSRCIKNPCTPKGMVECLDSECTWTGSACTRNDCVRLGDAASSSNPLDCPSGCVANNALFHSTSSQLRCVPDPCSSHLPDNCPKDCTNSTSCLNNQCVRLNPNIDPCPGACVLDRFKACVIPSPCSETARETCNANVECFWHSTSPTPLVGTCEYNHCAYQYNDDINKTCLTNSTCQWNRDKLCIPVTCGGYTTDPDCSLNPECVWNYKTGKCLYNSCIYQSVTATGGSVTCLTGTDCVLKDTTTCVPNLCGEYTSTDTCKGVCRWDVGSGSCVYNPCILQSGGSCTGNCVLGNGSVCIPNDVCSGLSAELCTQSVNCVNAINTGVCEYNEGCNQASSCPSASCVLLPITGYPAGKCVKNQCSLLSTQACNASVDCIWSGGACSFNPCTLTTDRSGSSGSAWTCTPSKAVNALTTVQCISSNRPGICVPNNCTDPSYQNCAPFPNCLYNYSSSDCTPNTCAGRYVSQVGNGVMGYCNDSGCMMSMIGTSDVCIPTGTCTLYNNAESSCIMVPGCRYNSSTNVCYYDPCVAYHDAVGVCQNLAQNGVRTCELDSSGKCVTENCEGKTSTDCVGGDVNSVCVYNSVDGTCTYDRCISQHVAGVCNTGCKKDKNNRCIPDRCASYTTQSHCEALDECLWNYDGCVHNHCINESSCSSDSSCQPPANAPGSPLCINNRCTTAEFFSSQDRCGKAPECLWSVGDGACMYNPCVNNGACTDSAVSTSNVCVRSEEICVPNKCPDLSTDSAKCAASIECLYNNVSNDCEYNPCISKKTGSGSGLMCDPGCLPALKGHYESGTTHEICIPDNWCNKYTDKTKCEVGYECRFDSSNLCIYNPCVTKYNKVEEGSASTGVCIEDALNCRLFNGHCYPLSCSSYNLDPEGCNAEPMCQYNQTVCIYNPCSEYATGDCLGKCHITNGKCVEDLCGQFNGRKEDCKTGGCLYFDSNATCVYNPCYQVGSSNCVDGNLCLKDRDNYCVPNPCTGVETPQECVALDCKWENAICEHHSCTRLHSEISCYPDCVTHPIEKTCHIDPCPQYTASGKAECEANECVWRGTPKNECLYTECKRLDEEFSCYHGCVENAYNICITDPCYGRSVFECTLGMSINEMQVDCIWHEASSKFSVEECISTSCTRLEGATTCPAHCLLEDRKDLGEGRSSCVENPCYGLFTEEDCKGDCVWRDGVCNYTKCTRFHQELDCVGNPTDPDRAKSFNCSLHLDRCLPDPCFNVPLIECPKDCIRADDNGFPLEICIASVCTRLPGERPRECMDGCIVYGGDGCVPAQCADPIGFNCPGRCKHNVSTPDQCISDPCSARSITGLNPNDCYVDSDGLGDVCLFVDDRCESVSEGQMKYDNSVDPKTCPDGYYTSVDETQGGKVLCKADPCARYLGITQVHECERGYGPGYSCELVGGEKCRMVTSCEFVGEDGLCMPGCLLNVTGQCYRHDCDFKTAVECAGDTHCLWFEGSCVWNDCIEDARNLNAASATAADCGIGCSYNPTTKNCEFDQCRQYNSSECSGNCAMQFKHILGSFMPDPEIEYPVVNIPGGVNVCVWADPCINYTQQQCPLQFGDGFSCILGADKTSCRSTPDESHPQTPDVCLAGAYLDYEGKCRRDDCRFITNKAACEANDLCVFSGSKCMWNDCLEKPENLEAETAEDAKCGVGCVYGETLKQCEFDPCRSKETSECKDGCTTTTKPIPSGNNTICIAGSGKPPGDNGGFPWYVIVIIIVVVLAAVAAGICCFCWYKKKQKG